MSQAMSDHPALLVLYQFSRLAHDVESRLSKDHPELSSSEISLLLHAVTPLRMKDLANVMRCMPSNVTPLVKRVEFKGLIEKKRSESDARTILVELTKQGCALRETLIEEIVAHVYEISGMCQEDFTAILGMMKR